MSVAFRQFGRRLPTGWGKIEWWEFWFTIERLRLHHDRDALRVFYRTVLEVGRFADDGIHLGKTNL